MANRALLGLGVFLVLVVLFIWAYFREWKMSVGAIVALVHDLIITVGVYALSGFEVTPATVTGILTILGFSLYDTVVVFDKVRENTKNLARTRQTYAEAANLAVNQTLVRSINTSIVALLPVGALLYVGVVSLGSGALKDLALALFVGMAAGAYSSIFIATPLVVQLKELEPGIKAGDARAMKHRNRKAVDPYAEVPVFTDDMPVQDEPGADDHGVRRGPRERARGDARPGRPATPRGSGRPPGRSRRPRRPSGRSRAASPARSAASRDRRRALALIRDVPDFPQPGVVFKDITPLLADHTAFTAVVTALADAGRDADGATRRRQGRRHGGPRVHPRGAGGAGARRRLRAGPQGRQAARRDPRGLLRPGVRRGDPRGAPATASPRATGCCSSTTSSRPVGTADATRQLVELCGGTVHAFAVLMELSFLHGRDAIDGMPLHSLQTV